MDDQPKTGEKPAPIEHEGEMAAPAPLRRDFYFSRSTHSIEPLDQVETYRRNRAMREGVDAIGRAVRWHGSGAAERFVAQLRRLDARERVLLARRAACALEPADRAALAEWLAEGGQ